MNCLSEALGLALPGNSSIPAPYSARMQFANRSCMKIMELVEKDIKPRNIVTERAFENAMTVDRAFGCSISTALQIPAVAHEVGLKIDMHDFKRLNGRHGVRGLYNNRQKYAKKKRSHIATFSSLPSAYI